MSAFSVTIWYLNIALTFAFVLRLLLTRLFRSYPYLFAFLSTNAVQSVALALIHNGRNRYAEVYMLGQSIKMALSIFLVLELYRAVLQNQPALAKFGRKTAGYAFVLAGGIAIVGTSLDPTVPRGQSAFLHRFFTIERTMDLAVLLFLLIIAVFMLWFPLRLKRNYVFYAGGFVVFYFTQTVQLLMLNLLSPEFLAIIATLAMTASLVCLVTWLIALRRRGEFTTTVVGHSWNQAAVGRLSGQLSSINEALVRLSRQ